MNLTVQNFTQMAQRAAREKGYLDIEKVVKTDANGQALLDANGQAQTEDRLVLKGTGLLARLKRHFGVRPEGADQRVQTAFITTLSAEAGLKDLNRLAAQDRALLEGAGGPSARRRIAAAAHLAHRLIDEHKVAVRDQAQKAEAQRQTAALIHSTVIEDFPDNPRFIAALAKAHAELQAADPMKFPPGQVFLTADDLRHLPSKEVLQAAKPELLSPILHMLQRADAVRTQADPKSPLPQTEVERVVVDSLKRWISKIRPMHGVLDQVGLPPAGPHGDDTRVQGTARRLIAAIEDLGHPVPVEVFDRSVRTTPECAQQLLEMASADPTTARNAIQLFMRQAALGVARELDPIAGAVTFATGTSDFVQIPLALSIAKERGLNVDQLKSNLADAPEVRTLLKGQSNVMANEAQHGNHWAAVLNRTSQLTLTLLQELDRGSDGVIGMGAAETLSQELGRFDPTTEKYHFEYDIDVDGPILRQLVGLDLRESEAEFIQRNQSTIRQLFEAPDFMQELRRVVQGVFPADFDLAPLLPSLERVATQHLQDQCSVNGMKGERSVIRAADPADARTESLQFIKHLFAPLANAAQGQQAVMAPAGPKPVYWFTSPTVTVPFDRQDFQVPMAGSYAAGGAMRRDIAHAIQDDLDKAADQGPLAGHADKRLNPIVRDLARGMIEVRPSDSPAVRPRRSPEGTAETDRPRLTQAFGQALESLIVDPARRTNAQRDLGVLCHQGLIGTFESLAEREMPEQALGFHPEQGTTQPIVLQADPDQPGSILITWNQTSTDLDALWMNGTRFKLGGVDDAESAALPALCRAGLSLRYTPSDEPGKAGRVEVLGYQRSIRLTDVDQPLVGEMRRPEPALIDERGELKWST